MEITQKPLPSNIEAERKILGCLILNNSLLPSIDNIIQEQDFYDSNHRILYGIILSLIDFKVGTTSITIVEALKKKGLDRKVGGTEYIERLTKNISDTDKENIIYYAKLISEQSKKRKLYLHGKKVEIEALTSVRPIDEIVMALQQEMLSLSGKMITKKWDIKESLHDLFDYLENFGKKHSGLISTGWTNLDYMFGGWMRKMVYTIGGRPSMGKTSFVLSAALKILFQQMRVLILSLEMSKNRILSRMISTSANVSNKKVMGIEERTGEEISRMYQAGEQLSELELVLDENCYTMSRIKKSIDEHKPDVVILDYLQNMQYGKGANNLPQEIALNMAYLKRLAMEKNLVMLVASQVQRAMDDKKAKEYRMKDLKGSGGIEESSDVVMFTVWSNKAEEDFELVIEKNKITGETGILNFKFRRDYGTFEEA